MNLKYLYNFGNDVTELVIYEWFGFIVVMVCAGIIGVLAKVGIDDLIWRLYGLEVRW